MRVVILCGGSGTRLWPESRESLPKQFIPIINEKSLLDLTVERVLKKLQEKKPIFLCNKNHGFLVKETLNKYKLEADIFLEPQGKSTCAAIYLAAKNCSNNDNLIIMPSDHLIDNYHKFIKDVSSVENYLTSDNWITLGIKPTKPSDAYGYIKIIHNKNQKLQKVVQFIEKPSKKIASKLIDDDNYFWNAGIFIANVATIKRSVKEHAPKIALACDKTFSKLTKNQKTNEFNFPSNLFSQIPSVSIDNAVMEHEKNISLLPFDGGWSDVGSWDTIANIKIRQKNDKVIQIDSNNNFIRSKKRTIATIGINDLIIVDSDDATLISKKNHTEKVKKL